MRHLAHIAGAVVVTAGLVLQQSAFAADEQVEDVNGQELVTALWQSNPRSSTAALNLITASADVQELYQWLKTGPVYSSDVPKGELVKSRVASDGTVFPYMVYIPEDYDPAQMHAVEFILHGGVNRPKPNDGDNFWERSLERVGSADRITVIPVSWPDHFWWQQNQAENLPAILNEIKREYNVDENRVILTGISDGGTGAYFFAFKQPTEWAAFLPYIGHPGVLRNPQSGGGYRLYFENLAGKPLFIVNGELDRLYPAASLESFMEILEQEGIDHTWRVIAEGGHNTNWMPEERERIEQFKLDNPRDPLPDEVQWVADRTDLYNRNHWVRVDAIDDDNTPSLLKVEREGNLFTVDARGVSEFTLLLNPEEIDFNETVTVNINGRDHFNGMVEQSSETLLQWARQDLDRSMLFTAELGLQVND